jgi:hypothetical protein
MTREQLEQKLDGLEAQMQWAALHHGDRELMDVLRDESDRLSGMKGRYLSEADHRQHRSSRAWTAWRAPPVISSTSSMPSCKRVLAARSRTPGRTPRHRTGSSCSPSLAGSPSSSGR